MGKKAYSFEELIQELKASSLFSSISGTFELSCNKTAYKKDTPLSFPASEEELHVFIQDVYESLAALSKVLAQTAPREWAPLPGHHKEDLINRFLERPDLYLEFLDTDPHIVLIRKINDQGKEIIGKISSFLS
ncbi:MAG: hypothetical protein JW769_05370 [Parachlamydiales bacterium]|nr:hypothetical protein [Parachlamydiales bacterium]